jgi:hypothetical protein
MQLYKINDLLKAGFDEETGEILDEKKLQDLEIEKSQKIEGIGLWIKNLSAELEGLERERKYFEARCKQKKVKIQNLKGYLTEILHEEKFESDKLLISWRKSKKLSVEDEREIPAEFWIVPEAILDRQSLKDALKAGREIQGCSLEENQNIQIK